MTATCRKIGNSAGRTQRGKSPCEWSRCFYKKWGLATLNYFVKRFVFWEGLKFLILSADPNLVRIVKILEIS